MGFGLGCGIGFGFGFGFGLGLGLGLEAAHATEEAREVAHDDRHDRDEAQAHKEGRPAAAEGDGRHEGEGDL